MRHMMKLTTVLALALLFAGGCREQRRSEPGAGAGVQHVTLALNWFPEVEHGGFYAALVHGYYGDEGLEVEILPGGPGAHGDSAGCSAAS